MTIYEELYKKAQTSEPITLADLRRLAEYDAVVSACMAQYAINGRPLEDALKTAVCVLAAQLNATREQLDECRALNRTSPIVTIVDNG